MISCALVVETFHSVTGLEINLCLGYQPCGVEPCGTTAFAKLVYALVIFRFMFNFEKICISEFLV